MALMANACQTGMQPKGDDLNGVVKRFHHNLRWKYNEDVAARVAPAYSNDFRDRLEDLSKDWNVTSWDVRKVELDKEGKRARIRVQLSYYYLNSPVVKEEKVDEVWELVEDQWILVEWNLRPLEIPPDKPGDEAGRADTPAPKKPIQKSPPKDTVRDLPDPEDGE